jgi:hypothetical protein
MKLPEVQLERPAPIPQGTRHERTVDAGGVDGWILQPPTQAALGTLGQGGSGVDVGKPGREEATLGQQQPSHHPGEGP